jgi:hypothetical protein
MSPGPLALVAAMLTAPSNQTTAYTSTPVQITKCSLTEEFIPTMDGDVPSQEGAGSELTIHFNNVTPMPVSSVTFNVNIGGQTQTLVDSGTFTQGVPISHTFYESEAEGDDANCHVVSVQFKNGSTWM